MFYNRTDRTTRNNVGVKIRVPGFGSTLNIEYMTQAKWDYGEYFASIVESLVSVGYQRGINLHGAPYDFRKAASKLFS